MKEKDMNRNNSETLYDRMPSAQLPMTIYHEEFVEKMSDEYDPYAYVEEEEQDIKFYDYSLIEFDWVGDD